MDQYLDLGEQPLANSYHKAGELLPTFPLAVQVCGDCFHSQLTTAVSPDLLFKNYLYVSGTSNTLLEYFRWFVEKVMTDGVTFKDGPKRVLDIASNDGSLLLEFDRRGWDVMGVDPAENLAPIALAKGIKTHIGYWNLSTAQAINRQFDVIVGQNVLAHVSNPLDFLIACKASLEEGGRVYIQTSQSEMFIRNEFDTIYHEHHSFFSARSLQALAARAKLKVYDVSKVPVHGTSYLFCLVHDHHATTTNAMPKLIESEEKEGRYTLATYQTFANNAKLVVTELAEAVKHMRNEGRRVVGFGAAAKGMTLLNFGEIDLDFIADDNPMKWGLFTPGRNIPIVSPETLKDFKEDLAFVILAWNFSDEIRRKIKSHRPTTRDVFIEYFPRLRILED